MPFDDQLQNICKELAQDADIAYDEVAALFPADPLGVIRGREVRNVIVSPHHDDAALSVGARLLSGEISGAVVLVPFSISAYSRYGQRIHSVRELTEIRIEEDRTALEQFGTVLIALPMAEGPLRGYRSVPHLFSGIPDRDDMACAQLVALLDPIAQRLQAARWHFPQGIGGHVDHTIVAQYGLRAVEALGLAVEWYQDIPYTLTSRPAQGPSSSGRFGKNAIQKKYDVTDVFDRKIAILAGYRSQLDQGDLQLVRRAAAEPGLPGLYFERSISST